MEKNKKYYSSKQENMISKLLGWSVVSGSGSRSLHPGDIVAEEWLGECKTHETSGHRITFTYSVWKKITDEAVSKFKFPALFVDDGSQNISDTWCMFRQRPGIPHYLVDYITKECKTFTFSSSELYAYRSTFGWNNPTMFQIKWNGETVYVANLLDFFNMFK